MKMSALAVFLSKIQDRNRSHSKPLSMLISPNAQNAQVILILLSLRDDVDTIIKELIRTVRSVDAQCALFNLRVLSSNKAR